MHDIVNNVGVAYSIAPITKAAALTADVTKGTTVDLQGFNSAMLIVSIGALVLGDADATTGAVILEESDTDVDGDFTTVAADDLIAIDTLTGLVTANVDLKVGYKGSKRYIRAKATITTGASTGSFPFACIVIKSNAHVRPVAE